MPLSIHNLYWYNIAVCIFRFHLQFVVSTVQSVVHQTRTVCAALPSHYDSAVRPAVYHHGSSYRHSTCSGEILRPIHNFERPVKVNALNTSPVYHTLDEFRVLLVTCAPVHVNARSAFLVISIFSTIAVISCQGNFM